MAASSTIARIPRADHAEITTIADEKGITFGEALQIWRKQAVSNTDTGMKQTVSNTDTVPKQAVPDGETVLNRLGFSDSQTATPAYPDEVLDLLDEVLANQAALMQGQSRGEAQRGLMTRVTLEGQQVIAETVKARDYNRRVFDAFSSTVAAHPELSGDSETFKQVMLQALEDETEFPALPPGEEEEEDDAA